MSDYDVDNSYRIYEELFRIANALEQGNEIQREINNRLVELTGQTSLNAYYIARVARAIMREETGGNLKTSFVVDQLFDRVLPTERDIEEED